MDSPTVHKRPLLDDIPSQNGDGTDHRYKQAQVTLPPLESFAPRPPPQSNGIFQLPHPGPLHTSVSFPPMDSQEIDRLLPGSGTSNGRGPELPPIAQFASSGPSQALLTGQSMQPTQGFQPPHSLHMNPLQSINSLQSTQTSTTARSSSSQSRNPMSVAALINGSPSCSRPESSAFKPTSQPPPPSSSDVQPARLSSPSPELVAPIPVSLVPRDKPQANGTSRMPQVIVENDPSLNMGDIEERRLGYIVYNPKEILPPLEGNLNGILEVWISSNHLTWDNEKVKKRWIWGTDIYTDDTDVVAALIHTNRFTPLVPKSQLQAALPSDTLWNSTRPNYDLCVTVRVCRKLVQYRGALRNSLRSRSWGNHHGVSFMIESVRRMNEGEAIGRARGRGRKERLRRFHRMKKRVFEEQPKLMYKNHPARETVVVAFNREGDPCLKYTKSLLTDTDWLEKRLQKKVAILENDYERYELSFDRERGRYRFAVVSPAVHLGRRVPLETTGDSSTMNALTFPLGDAHIEEVISDDLGLENFEWNVVGVIVRVPGEEARSMLVVVKLLYLRDRVQQE